jgi:hypothetical protein
MGWSLRFLPTAAAIAVAASVSLAAATWAALCRLLLVRQ